MVAQPVEHAAPASGTRGWTPRRIAAMSPDERQGPARQADRRDRHCLQTCRTAARRVRMIARPMRAACGVVAIGMLLALPASADAAATRFAAPANQGTGDCSTAGNACALPTAVAGSGDGDFVE